MVKEVGMGATNIPKSVNFEISGDSQVTYCIDPDEIWQRRADYMFTLPNEISPLGGEAMCL